MRGVGAAYAFTVLAALLASLSWIEPGSFIAAGDVSPFVRDNLAQELWSSWNHQLTGAGSVSYEIARAPDVLLLTLAEHLGLPGWVAQHALFSLCFAFAGFGAAYLAGAFVRHRAAIAVAGLAGAFNPFVMVSLPNPLPLLAGGLLGVLVGMLWRHADGRRVSAVTFAAVTLVAAYLSVNPPLLAVIAVTVIAAAAVAGFVTGGRGGSRRALGLLARATPWALLLNLWWVVPVAQTTLGDHAGILLTAQTDVASWSWSHARASLGNVATLNAHWGWEHEEYFPYAEAMDGAPWSLMRWLLPVGAAVGAVAAARTHRRLAALLAATALVLIFIGKGLHPPLGSVNAWLYEHMPGLWLLRDPMSKVGMIVVLIYAVLLAVGVDRLVAASSRGRRQAGRVATALLGVGIVAAVWPLSTGAVFADDRKPLPPVHVEIPREWHAAAAAIDRSPVRGKALVLPLNTYYQVTTRWGYHGVDQIPQQMVRRPVIQRLPGGYFGDTDGFDALLTGVEEALSAGREQPALALLRSLGVSHVVVRHDVDPDSQSTAYGDSEALRRGLTDMQAARTVATSPLADVFEIPQAEGAVRAATSLVGVDGPDDTSRAAAIAAVPAGSVATGLDDAPLDAVHVRMPAARAQAAFRIARGGEHDIRRSGRAALYRLGVDDRARRLRLTDATTVRLDGRRLPRRPVLEIPFTRRPTAFSAGDRLHALKPGAVVALTDAPVIAYSLAAPRVLRDFAPLGDCNRSDDRGPDETGLSLSRTGPAGVRLRARAHTACTWLAVDSEPLARAYEIRLRHRRLSGAPPRICLWEEGPDRCASIEPLVAGARRGWQTYRTRYTPHEDVTGLRLYLYADGDAGEPTSVDYGDVRIAPMVESGRTRQAPVAPVTRRLEAGPHRLETSNPVPAATNTALSDLEDCGASDARTPEQAGLALLKRPAQSFELRARAHIACAWIGLPDLGSAELVRVAFDYRTLAGRPARACVWEVGPERCAELPALAATTGWRRFTTVLRPHKTTTEIRLFLYADGQESPPTRVEYRRPVLQPVAPVEIAVDRTSTTAGDSPQLRWTQDRPDRYRVAIRSSPGTFTLVLAESAAPGWSLDGLPAGWTAQRLVADGYASGWRVTGAGDADLMLAYAPSALGRAAIALSAAGAVAAVLVAAAAMRRRGTRRRRGWRAGQG